MCIIILQLVTLLNVIPSCQYYVLPYFSSYILSSQLIQILNVTESPELSFILHLCRSSSNTFYTSIVNLLIKCLLILTLMSVLHSRFKKPCVL